MQELIASEANWLKRIDSKHQALFVAALMQQLTIAGRASYRPQTEELEFPLLLRQINEIQHCLASAICHLLTEQEFTEIELFIARAVLRHNDNELQHALFQAWQNAKHYSTTRID